MPKKTTILIILLTVVTGALIFLALSGGDNREPGGQLTNRETPGDSAVDKTATVYFTPQNLLVTDDTILQSADIIVDTGNDNISGVQVELAYDPEVFTNVALEAAASASDFFGVGSVILLNEIEDESGRISYAVSIGPEQAPRTGVGKVATFYFQKAPGSNATSSTITFLNKTLVTKLGENESVLKSTTPLNITFSGNNTGQQNIPPVSPQTFPQ